MTKTIPVLIDPDYDLSLPRDHPYQRVLYFEPRGPEVGVSLVQPNDCGAPERIYYGDAPRLVILRREVSYIPGIAEYLSSDYAQDLLRDALAGWSEGWDRQRGRKRSVWTDGAAYAIDQLREDIDAIVARYDGGTLEHAEPRDVYAHTAWDVDWQLVLEDPDAEIEYMRSLGYLVDHDELLEFAHEMVERIASVEAEDPAEPR